MSRAKAFRAIRSVVGPEICPDVHGAVRQVKAALRHVPVDQRQEIREALGQVQALAHRTHVMRSALASMLTLLQNPDLAVCPQCSGKLPEHGAKCLVARLLA